MSGISQSFCVHAFVLSKERSEMGTELVLPISMPTKGSPGIGACMRMLEVASPRAIFFCRLVMDSTRTPMPVKRTVSKDKRETRAKKHLKNIGWIQDAPKTMNPYHKQFHDTFVKSQPKIKAPKETAVD